MSLFTGAGVALITPFNEDNSVNYEMLRTLVRRPIDGGTDAIIVCGTTCLLYTSSLHSSSLQM